MINIVKIKNNDDEKKFFFFADASTYKYYNLNERLEFIITRELVEFSINDKAS